MFHPTRISPNIRVARIVQVANVIEKDKSGNYVRPEGGVTALPFSTPLMKHKKKSKTTTIFSIIIPNCAVLSSSSPIIQFEASN